MFKVDVKNVTEKEGRGGKDQLRFGVLIWFLFTVLQESGKNKK